jgi:hypothetical protein
MSVGKVCNPKPSLVTRRVIAMVKIARPFVEKSYVAASFGYKRKLSRTASGGDKDEGHAPLLGHFKVQNHRKPMNSPCTLVNFISSLFFVTAPVFFF